MRRAVREQSEEVPVISGLVGGGWRNVKRFESKGNGISLTINTLKTKERKFR
jgi:hypothetical protein